MRKLWIVVVALMMTVLAACSEDPTPTSQDVEPITSIEMYNRITEDELIERVGEPLQREEVIWTTPSDGKQITLTQLDYEIDTIPATFFIVEDRVVRLNFYIEEWDEQLQVEDAEMLLSILSITPEGEAYRIRVDNEKNMQIAWPHEEIDEVYAKHQRGTIQEIRITYDMTPF